MRVFLDTNILLDVIAQRDEFYEPAARVWGMAEARKIQALISAISFNNVFYIVRKFAGRQRATEALRLMRQVFDVVAVDGRIIDAAIGCGTKDFEDSVQYHCAIRAKAGYLITRNPQDFPNDGPAVLSAEEFLGLISQ